MKKLYTSLAASAVFLAGYAIGAAPAALDPVNVAPHIYEVAFENDKVRVLKKTLRNGETAPLVSQPDRVIVYLNPCAWMVTRPDGSEYMESFKFGTPVWADANSHGGETSNVIQQCSIIEVELKTRN